MIKKEKIIDERQLACNLVEDVLRDKTFLESASSSSNFIKMLTHTYFRNKVYIDNVLKQKIRKPLPEKAFSAYVILSLGITELLFLNTPAYAVLNSYVELIKSGKLNHLKDLTNAVLRSCQNLDKENIPCQTSNWLTLELIRDYGTDLSLKIIKSLTLEPCLDLSVKSDALLWAEKLNGIFLDEQTVRLTKPSLNIIDLNGFNEGAWWVQDFAASLPVKLMGNIKDKNILDMCAAPGGKTFQLLNKGAKVTALDKSAKRLKKLNENLKRLNLQPQEIVCIDAKEYQKEAQFDIVLLDAPCSATGTVRKHPELPFIKNEKDADELQKTQVSLLKNAASLTKSNGFIYYCTCSLNKDEGENLILSFLKENSNVKLYPLNIKDNNLQSFITKEGMLRALPFYMEESGGMDGFFIAALQKI